MIGAFIATLATEVSSTIRDVMDDAQSREAVPPPTQNSQAESPAPSVDRYSIANVTMKIGEGADSEVIVAFNVTTGAPVAMKIVKKVGRPPEHIQRSRFEGLLISTMFDHPNIVRGYPVIEDEERLVIPMELSPMGDLLSLVNRRQGLREDEARHIFRQLVEGLGHAHSKGVVHGDMKLDNVRGSLFPSQLSLSGALCRSSYFHQRRTKSVAVTTLHALQSATGDTRATQSWRPRRVTAARLRSVHPRSSGAPAASPRPPTSGD